MIKIWYKPILEVLVPFYVSWSLVKALQMPKNVSKSEKCFRIVNLLVSLIILCAMFEKY